MANFTTIDFIKLQKEVEETTGFKCYEGQPGDQQIWYGTSDKLASFKLLVNKKLPTGSVAYLIDTKTKLFYSNYKNAWY